MKNFLPRRSDFPRTRSDFFRDLIAGISVAVVALPLAIGFGITTGTGAASGLITAIIAGFIAALFGGSRFQVSGPTGAMTVILVPVVAKQGIASLLVIGILAGIVVLVMGFLKLGNIINKVPFSVVEGFTLGIALVIALQQVPFALNIPKAAGDHIIPVTWRTITSALSNGIDWISLGVVALTLLVKFSVPPILKTFRVKVHLPASFIAMVVASFISVFFHLNLQSIGSIPRKLFVLPKIDWQSIDFAQLAYPVIAVAFLAAIESLLSARIADGMAHQKSQEKFDPNRELFGQGLASTVSSIFGGIPATGAIARTSVNVRSHAQTRVAAMIHSIFLVIVVMALSPLFSQIPTAVIAGVLIGTSMRIFNPRSIREMLRTTFDEILIFGITAITTVAIDLIWGIALGIAAHVILKRVRISR